MDDYITTREINNNYFIDETTVNEFRRVTTINQINIYLLLKIIMSGNALFTVSGNTLYTQCPNLKTQRMYYILKYL